MRLKTRKNTLNRRNWVTKKKHKWWNTERLPGSSLNKFSFSHVVHLGIRKTTSEKIGAKFGFFRPKIAGQTGKETGWTGDFSVAIVWSRNVLVSQRCSFCVIYNCSQVEEDQKRKVGCLSHTLCMYFQYPAVMASNIVFQVVICVHYSASADYVKRRNLQ